MFRLACASLVLPLAVTLRKRRAAEVSDAADNVEATEVDADVEASSTRPTIDLLVTYGCPKVSVPALRNPRTTDGCFPGWRVVNKNNELLDLTDDVDLVPTLLGVSGYEHIAIPTQFIDQRGQSTFHNCGWKGNAINTPKITLHFVNAYVDRAGKNSNVQLVTMLGLRYSYNKDVNAVKNALGASGWNVASALIGGLLTKEVVHLMQNRANFECILTFAGSETYDDWINDAIIVTTTFCGLAQRVHTGFKRELLSMVKATPFIQTIMPRIPKCAKLRVVGHSLGGATAALFTACAHSSVVSGQVGWDDKRYMTWTKTTPGLFTAMTQAEITSMEAELPVTKSEEQDAPVEESESSQ